MTGQELTGLIGALGFPIVLVLGLLWFVKRDVWPWFVADQKQRREVESLRHADYIKTYERSAISQEAFSKAFMEFSTTVKGQHDAQSDQASGNHSEVVGILRNEVITRLDKIDRNTGAGGLMKQR